MQQTTTPWMDIWNAVVEAAAAAADTYTIGCVLTAWALTHGFKLWLEHRGGKVTERAASWRFFVWVGSVVCGGVSAALWAWGWTDNYEAIPVIAILSPLAWLVAVRTPRSPFRRVLTTTMDRKLLGY